MGQMPEHLADAFGAVVRVPGADWDACDHVTLPGHARLTRGDRETARRLADAVVKAWRVADDEPPALADMRKLVAQLTPP